MKTKATTYSYNSSGMTARREHEPVEISTQEKVVRVAGLLGGLVVAGVIIYFWPEISPYISHGFVGISHTIQSEVESIGKLPFDTAIDQFTQMLVELKSLGSQ